jgi:hypothetical protein
MGYKKYHSTNEHKMQYKVFLSSNSSFHNPLLLL